MTWEERKPLFVNADSAEPFYAPYRAWMFEPDKALAVTRSEFESLRVNQWLYEEGKITLQQACMNEMTFCWYGWTWVDRPERHQKSITKQVIEAVAKIR